MLLALSPSRAQLPAIPSEVCNANGTVAVAVNGRTGVATWTLKGSGQCVTPIDDLNEATCTDRYGDPCSVEGTVPPFTFSASGSSTGAGGLCSGVLVQHLSLKATLSVPSFGADPFDGQGFWGSALVQQRWSIGKTIFPGVTPLRIYAADGAQSTGVGVIVDRSGACLSQVGQAAAHFTLVFGY